MFLPITGIADQGGTKKPVGLAYLGIITKKNTNILNYILKKE